MRKLLKKRISIKGLILFTICTVDLAITVFLLQEGLAVEGNFLLKNIAAKNLLLFCLVKVVSYCPAIIFFEWLETRHPKKIDRLYQGIITSYMLIYLSSILIVNS